MPDRNKTFRPPAAASREVPTPRSIGKNLRGLRGKNGRRWRSASARSYPATPAPVPPFRPGSKVQSPDPQIARPPPQG